MDVELCKNLEYSPNFCKRMQKVNGSVHLFSPPKDILEVKLRYGWTSASGLQALLLVYLSLLGLKQRAASPPSCLSFSFGVETAGCNVYVSLLGLKQRAASPPSCLPFSFEIETAGLRYAWTSARGLQALLLVYLSLLRLKQRAASPPSCLSFSFRMEKAGCKPSFVSIFFFWDGNSGLQVLVLFYLSLWRMEQRAASPPSCLSFSFGMEKAGCKPSFVSIIFFWNWNSGLQALLLWV